MKENNNFTIILGTLAIIMLLLAFFVHYGTTNKVTGLVVGTVNVTINQTIGVSLSRNSINFTSSNPGTGRTTYTAADLASAPLPTCTYFANATCGLNITNDGSVNLNITMQDTGSVIFTSSSFTRKLHFLFNVSVPYSARSVICKDTTFNGFYNVNNTHIRTGGFVPSINWTPVNTTAITIICGLNSTNTGYGAEVQPDVASIDFNITIPTDESAGTKGTTLEITGINSGLSTGL